MSHTRLFLKERFTQAAKHSALFFGGVVNRAKCLVAEKALAVSDESLRNDFEGRSGSDLQKPGEIGFRDS